MRKPLWLCLALGALVLPAASRGADPWQALGEITLSPKARLALPHRAVPVGPGRPLRLLGRKEPLRFTEREGRLLFGGRLLREGKAFAVPLDGKGERHLALSRDSRCGRWLAVDLDARRGRIGGRKVLFLDRDANGSFLTPHRDVITDARGTFFHPVAPNLVIGGDRFRLETDEAGGRIAVRRESRPPSAEIFPRWREVARALAFLNRVRAGLNVPPVALHEDASRRAMLHLRYGLRNDTTAHREDPSRPGYTEEGARAGLDSLGYRGPGGPVVAIEGHLSSLLHRMELIDPTVTEIGIAAAADRVWIHTECGKRRPFREQGPVIFPGGSSPWISGTYSPDRPDPRPAGARGPAGVPVTVAFYGGEVVKNLRAELTCRGRAVPCFRNDARGRELRTNHAALRAVLLPKAPLAAGTYVLHLSWTRDGAPRALRHAFTIR